MDLHAAEALVAEHGADRVTEALRPYLSEDRRVRIDEVVAGRMASLHVAIEAPSDPHNAAAIVRTADALGALGVHVIAAEGKALHAPRTTKGAFRWVQTHHHERLEPFLRVVRGQRMRLAGACMDGSVPVTRLPLDEPLCLLLGNERRGLSAAARGACDLLFHVPMVGMSQSLNVSVTAAISMFEVLQRKRAAGATGDLDEAQRQRLRACYYAVGSDPRLLEVLYGVGESPEVADAR
ncbi:MAG: RNA methyltransferase [Nannocystaceae bacterium]